ncbi:hypothetical protein RIF29_17116 [Crotalaria pallida]|uniref:Uncharacterized protein n=1 Tax=Crotalaria pallida TaxID=3830 RepID=A0AAN9FPY1_CROPI
MGDNDTNKKTELIFIPSPGIGHLTSALEFAQLLIKRDSNLSITVLCIKFPFTPFSDSYIKSVLASQPQIQLIDLPEVEPPSHELLLKSPEYCIFAFMESLIPHLEDVFNDSDPELLIPGLSNLVPSSVLPDACFSKDGGYVAYYNTS